MLATATHFVPE